MLQGALAGLVVFVSLLLMSQPGQVMFWISWCERWFLFAMLAIALIAAGVLGYAALLAFDQGNVLADWPLAQAVVAGLTAAGLLRIDLAVQPRPTQRAVTNLTSLAFARLTAELNKSARGSIRDWAMGLQASSLILQAAAAPATPVMREQNGQALDDAVSDIQSGVSEKVRFGRGKLVAYVTEVFVLQFETMPGRTVRRRKAVKSK